MNGESLLPFQKQLRLATVLICMCVLAVIAFNMCNSGITWKRYTRYVRDVIQDSLDLLNMSQQDGQPVMRLMHLVQAETRAEIAQQMMSSAELEKYAGVYISELLRTLKTHRQQTLREVHVAFKKSSVNTKASRTR